MENKLSLFVLVNEDGRIFQSSDWSWARVWYKSWQEDEDGDGLYYKDSFHKCLFHGATKVYKKRSTAEKVAKELNEIPPVNFIVKELIIKT